ncbi:hypothetical protein HPB48_023000 [Haemaphysalis longicornis]|uniref:Serine/threonine specific protein phosphatases domain-containing protein n=1 Tax=Haemaphysalis longicornis TaxID=44386 RepID=A0A9J6FWL3_HAELO|nr:hypothetical protein HPB48_023000 [Haemaphysalis longicornis]
MLSLKTSRPTLCRLIQLSGRRSTIPARTVPTTGVRSFDMNGGAGDVSALDRHIQQLRRCETIDESDVRRLRFKAQGILPEQGNVRQVDSLVTICGGQFYDLKELFTGDFVDRGFYGVETVLLLLALKETTSRSVTRVYAFYDGSASKYSSANVWGYLKELLYYLSFSAPFTKGVSAAMTLDQLQINEPMCDVLRTNPQDRAGRPAQSRRPLRQRRGATEFNTTNE